jgi:uncharacterized membrane protein
MPQEKSASPADELQRNIQSVMRLEKKALLRRTGPERLADAVTAAAGSMPCVVLHALFFTAWILANTGKIPGIAPFDRWPFSFLTFVVSLEAIFLTLLVLLSQKRILKEADKRAHLDLQIDMLAEQESTITLKLVRRICEHLGVENDEEQKSAAHLAEMTDVRRLAQTLEKNLPK